MKKFKIITFCIALVFSFLIIKASDIYGYGYGLRGKDTLVAVYENIAESIKRKNYERIKEEIRTIEVPFANYHNYYGINLQPKISQAIKEKNSGLVIKTIEQLIYFAIREKIYWNKKEKLEKFVASKARLKVIFQYYTLLKPQIMKFDKNNNATYNKKLMDLIFGMKNTLGASGAFGYKSTPPNLQEFIKLSGELEKIFVIIFPHFELGYKAVINPH